MKVPTATAQSRMGGISCRLVRRRMPPDVWWHGPGPGGLPGTQPLGSQREQLTACPGSLLASKDWSRNFCQQELDPRHRELPQGSPWLPETVCNPRQCWTLGPAAGDPLVARESGSIWRRPISFDHRWGRWCRWGKPRSLALATHNWTRGKSNSRLRPELLLIIIDCFITSPTLIQWYLE